MHVTFYIVIRKLILLVLSVTVALQSSLHIAVPYQVESSVAETHVHAGLLVAH